MVKVTVSEGGLTVTIREAEKFLPISRIRRSSILSEIVNASEIGDVVQLDVDDGDFLAWLPEITYRHWFEHTPEAGQFLSAALKAADFLNDQEATSALSINLSKALFPAPPEVTSNKRCTQYDSEFDAMHEGYGRLDVPDPEALSQVLNALPCNLSSLVLSHVSSLGLLLFRLPRDLHPLAITSSMPRQPQCFAHSSSFSIHDQRACTKRVLEFSPSNGFSASSREPAAHLCRAMATVSAMATAAARSAEPPSATLPCSLQDPCELSFTNIATTPETDEQVSRQLCHLLSSLPSLRAVNLEYTWLRSWTEVSRALSALPALTSIACTTPNFSGVLCALAEFPVLQYLQVTQPSSNHLPDAGVPMSWAPPMNLRSGKAVLSSVAPALRELALVDFETCTPQHWAQVRLVFKWLHVPLLETLEIHDTHLHDADCDDLAGSLLFMRSLRKLRLYSCTLPMGILARGMAGLAQLESLTLHDALMDDWNARLLAEQFCSLSCLKTLLMNVVSWSTEVWGLLAAKFGQLSQLQCLDVSDSWLADESSCVLAAHFGELPQLQKLCFHRCSIGERGARAIAAALPKLRSLETLCVHRNDFGEKWKEILGAPHYSCSFDHD